MSPYPITEVDLQAYVDSRLPESRQAEIEDYMAANPGEAERLHAYRAQNVALRKLFAPVLDEPLPENLLRLAQPPALAVDRKKWTFLPSWSLQRMAAGIAVAVLGGAAGWLGHGYYQVGQQAALMAQLPHHAAVAHAVFSPDVRRPVEVSADQEEQLVKWLSKRLGTPVSPPKLGGVGYELVGGRLLPGASGPVAQFMYQDAKGQRMTLYLTPENHQHRDAGFRFAREGEVNVFYWVDGKFGYALSANIDKGELAKVATAVYDQLGR